MQSKKKKNRNKPSGLISTIIGIVVIGAGLFGWYGYHAYENHLIMQASEQLAAEEDASAETQNGATEEKVPETAVSDMNNAEDSASYDYQQKIKALWQTNDDGTVTYQDKTYKRNSYMKAILCMGIDRSDELNTEDFKDTANAGRADAVMVLAQDTSRNKVKILMIPRDTLCEIDVYDDEGNFLRTQLDHVSISHIGGGGGKKSCEITQKAVSNLLCGLSIDYYMAIDMSLLKTVNDAVDGVTVTIPNDQLVKADPSWTMGTQVTLKGDQAEKFIRYRDLDVTSSPVMRMQQHRAYMLGFFDAVKQKSKSDSNIVPELCDMAEDHMVTDMQKADYMKIAVDELTNDSLNNEAIVSLPGYSGMGSDGYDLVVTDYESAIPVILDLFYREVS